ncbi:alpha/beta hydrolase [uncultured Variovorax sp.]|uniref:alpha/beta fold hydrolase n=1 Tax=uncultured Variovorax sp. TaxID=114708 RepID=UPI0025ED7B59|nr:alpha/beta hydrolase [uncultured Variovorax sp.]
MSKLEWIEVPGASLAVEHQADASATGMPVLFLHANVADRRMWHGQWSALAPAHPVASYDRRGFGDSRTLHATPHSNVADLWAVMDSLGYRKAVLVGCSLGGRVAIDAALARPDRVSGLVVVAPGVSGAPSAQHGEPVSALTDAISAAAARGDLDAKNELQARLWLDGPLSPPGRVGGAARELFLSMNGNALRAAHPGTATEEPSAWARLEAIQAPTFVMWGDLDLPLLQERCSVLAQRIPGAESFVLRGTAHLPALEAPQQFNSLLGRYLDGL